MKPKLAKVIENLPKTNFNVTEAAKMAEYSKSYSETLIHKTIRKYIGVKTDEEIKDEFLKELDKDIKRFKREKDNTNYLRAKELKSKILGLQTDKVEMRSNLVVTEADKQEVNRLKELYNVCN